MDPQTKDTNEVFYCQPGDHFWRWAWTDQEGGYYYPAYEPDNGEHDPDNERYCGCND